MRHDVSHLSSMLDTKLSDIRAKNNGLLNTINDSFVFAFGPFLAMEPGFEVDCDDMAKYSDPMRVIQFAAFLIRSITSGVSYGDAKKIIKNFIIEVDNEFPQGTHKNIHESLIRFATEYLHSLREEQGTNMESFITNSAPIVPYEGMMKKQPLEPGMETRIDCVDEVQKVIVNTQQNRAGNQDTLMAILLNNLAGIMIWKDLTTIIEDPETGANNLMELDHLILDRDNIPYAVRGYYFLATINYYGLPIEIFDKYLKFIKEAGNFTRPQSYEAFEAMINEMAETVNPNISLESWDDPEMERRANELYQKALIVKNVPQDRAKHDLNAILSFIAKNRSFQFGEWPRRAFVASLHELNVVNVNNFANNVTIYEMSNNTLMVPFVSIIDWQVRVIIQAENQDDEFDIRPLNEVEL